MTDEVMNDLAAKIADKITPKKPSPYCNASDIAAMLFRTVSYVRVTYCCHPDFPRPINLPVRGKQSKTGHDLWKTEEVHEWVENFQRKAARRISPV